MWVYMEGNDFYSNTNNGLLIQRMQGYVIQYNTFKENGRAMEPKDVINGDFSNNEFIENTEDFYIRDLSGSPVSPEFVTVNCSCDPEKVSYGVNYNQPSIRMKHYISVFATDLAGVVPGATISVKDFF